MRTIKVDDSMTGERLDLLLLKFFPDLSRSSIQKLNKAGLIKVNGISVKTGYNPRAKDNISIDYDYKEASKTPDIEIPIIYEDDNCIVINKPVGLLSHSKGSLIQEATVASWLQPKLEGLEGNRAGIVHRLDRATSGVMILAKNDDARKLFQKQFSTQKTKKTYKAVIVGEISPPEAIIDMPIQRNPKTPATFRVAVNGKPSITAYKTLDVGEKYSLIELKPKTGRTHQLRVHLSKQGHSIVGDKLYEGEDASRLYLHAEQLEITIPGGERKIFKSPLPESFERLVHDSHE